MNLLFTIVKFYKLSLNFIKFCNFSKFMLDSVKDQKISAKFC